MLVIAQLQPAHSRLCLRVCVQLLEVRGDQDEIAHACLEAMDRLLGTVSEEERREALLWTMQQVLARQGGDVRDGLLVMLVHHGQCVLAQTEEVCRVVLLHYAETAASTRMVLLQLLTKLRALDPENEAVKLMFEYTLELNWKDTNVEVRVQARNIRAVGVGGECEVADDGRK